MSSAAVVPAGQQGLPGLDECSAHSVRRLNYPEYGSPNFVGDRFLIVHPDSGVHLTATILSSPNNRSLDTAVLNLGRNVPQMLPTEIWHNIPRQRDQSKNRFTTLTQKYCNGGVLWDFHELAKRQSQVPPPPFTCHIWLQLLQGLLSISRASMTHQEFRLEHFYLDFPSGDPEGFPDVLIGGYEKILVTRPRTREEPISSSTTIALMAMMSDLRYLMGQDDNYFMVDSYGDAKFAKYFRDWQKKFDALFKCLKDHDWKIPVNKYEEMLSDQIYEAKFVLKGVQAPTLPHWMTEYFNTVIANVNGLTVRVEPDLNAEVDDNGNKLIGSDNLILLQQTEYEVRSFLGQGEHGTVRLARAVEGGGEVALKTSKGLVEAAKALRLENKAMVKLEGSAGVIRQLGWFPDVPWEGVCTIALEYCNGGSVHDLTVAPGSRILPQDFVCYLISRLTRALAACYEAGVSHGDMSPRNWLMKVKLDAIYEFPKIVLADFSSRPLFDSGDDNPLKPRYVERDLAPLLALLSNSAKEYKDSDGAYNSIFRGFHDSLEAIVEGMEAKGDDHAGAEELVIEHLQEVATEAEMYLWGVGHKKKKTPDWMVVYFVKRL